MKILVTGATGRVGGQVAAQLAASPSVRVKALSRHPAATVPGAEVVVGDLADPASLDLAGIDAVFLVFPSVQADGAARDLIARLAPRRIVYLSAHGVPEKPDPAAEPNGTIMGSHAYLEGLISDAAPHTFLRSSGFAANTLAWAGQLRRSDTLRWFLPEARRSLVHEADLAAVAVAALTEDGHEGQTYHLTGPQQLSQAEQLATLGSALGRDLRFEEIDADEAAAELFPGQAPEVARSIIKGQSAMVEDPEPRTDEIARLTGDWPRTYATWARDHAADFQRPGRL
jgi:uncharacterized protein YbjT (DUF2867 family)